MAEGARQRGKKTDPTNRSKPDPQFVHSASTKFTCALFGKAQATLHRWVTIHDMPRNDDGTFDLRACVEWFADWQVSRAVSKFEGEIDKDKEPAGTELVANERAQLLRLERLEREKSLVKADVMKRILESASMHLRNSFKIIMRDHPEAYDVLIEGLDEFDRRLEKEFGTLESAAK